MVTNTDFKTVASELLTSPLSYLYEWLPAGQLIGKEFTCGSLGGNKGNSLKINIESGLWCDFATGEKGSDLISLYAAIKGITQMESLEKLAEKAGRTRQVNGQQAKRHTINFKSVPRGTPLPEIAHNGHGKPSDHYEYLDQDGNIRFFVARYDTKDGKHFTPISLTDDGWVKKLPTGPRPLFNLPIPSDIKNILIVEGEKAARAAHKFMPNKVYHVVTWHGGANAISKADWSPIYNKSILIWPDADEAGIKAANEIAQLLLPHCPEIKLLDVTDIAEKGWDAADSKFSWAQFREWAKPRAQLITKPEPAKPVTNPYEQDIQAGFSITEDNKKPKRLHERLYAYMTDTIDGTYIRDFSSFAIWDGKKYSFDSEYFIKNFAQRHYKPELTSITERNEYLEFCKSSRIARSKDYSLKDTGLINFQNGVYDLSTGKLMPHDRKYHLSTILPSNYKQGPCPTWDELMLIITLNRRHLQTIIEEFIGYAMSACDYNKLNKFLIFDGSGANGKSTVVRIITDLVGNENTAAVKLEDIGKNQFAASGLFNKLLNTCSESNVKCFADTGPLKALTGGDSMMIEEKFKGAIYYANLAKFIISYNEAPYLMDASAGFRRRPIIIPFDQDFEANPELKIKNPEKTIRETELDALATRCVDAFRKVLDRGHFTEVPESVEKLDEMLSDSDLVRRFIEDCLVTGREKDSNFIMSSLLYEKFKEYDAGATRVCPSEDSFGRRVRRVLGYKSSLRWNAITKSSKRGYAGIAFK